VTEDEEEILYMPPAREEFLGRLHATIADWQAEVAAAHTTLAQQIDTTNQQFHRLITVLDQRKAAVDTLAEARQEIARLKQVILEGAPPDAPLHFNTAETIESFRKLTHGSLDRVVTTIEAWKREVAAAERDIARQIAEADQSFRQLVRVLEDDQDEAQPEPPHKFDALREERDRFAAELDTIRAEWTAEREQVARRQAALQQELTRLRQAVEDAQASNGEQELARRHALELERGALRRALEERDVRIASLEAERDSQENSPEATARAAAAEAALATREDTLRDLQAQLEQTERELAAALKKAEAAEESEELRSLLVAAQARVENLEAAEVRWRSAEEALHPAEARAAMLEQELDAAQAQLANLNEALAEARGWEAAAKTAQDKLAAAQDELAQLTEERERLSQAAEAAAEALDHSHAGRAQEQQRIAQLEHQLRQLHREEASIALNAQEVRSRLELAQATLDQRDEDLRQLHDQLDNLRAELGERQQEHELLARDHVTLEERFVVLSRDHEALAARHGEAEAERLRLAEDLTEREMELAGAREQAQSLNAELDEAAARQERAEDQIRELNGRTAELEAERIRLEAVERQLRSDIEDRELQSAELQRELDAASDAAAAVALQVKALEETIARLEEDETNLNKATEEIHRLHQQLAAEAREQENLRGHIQKLEVARDALHGDKASLEEALERAGELAAAQQETLTRHDARAQQLGGEIEERDRTILALRGSAATAALRVQELEASLVSFHSLAASRDATWEETQSRLQDLDTSLLSRSAEVDELSERCTTLLSEQEAWMRERDLALEREAQAIARADTHEAALAALEGEREAWRDRNQALEEQLRQIQEELGRHGEELEPLRSELQHRDVLLEDLQRALAETTDALDAARGQLAGQEDAAELLQRQVEEQAATLEVAQAQVREQEEALSALHNQLAAREADGAGKVEVLTAREEELAALRAELEAQVREVDALSSRSLELEHELNALRTAEEASAAEALAEARSALDGYRSALSERDALISHLRNEAATLESRLRGARIQLEEERAEKERIWNGDTGVAPAARHSDSARRQRHQILVSETAAAGGARPLGTVLVEAGLLSREQLEAALNEQRRNPRELLGTVLVRREFTTEDAIAQAIACQMHLPLIEPHKDIIQRKAADRVRRDLCLLHVCVPVRIEGERLVLAMANPLDKEAIRKVHEGSGLQVKPVVAVSNDILSAIEDVYGG
jgi:chromosome segregation ATPase